MAPLSGPKPIETRYQGYRFRSRLEARWAVFFTALEIPWRYEPEGYDLGPDLGSYLCDFYLPTVVRYRKDAPGLWLEVKPVEPDWEPLYPMINSNHHRQLRRATSEACGSPNNKY